MLTVGNWHRPSICRSVHLYDEEDLREYYAVSTSHTLDSPYPPPQIYRRKEV